MSRSRGGSLARAYELVGPALPDWRDVHLWYGDERCVALDDEESNHRLATERFDAPDATWHPVPTQLGCDEAAAAYAQEIAGVTLDVAVNGMGPDGHTASLFPGFPQVHADGVCVAVHGAPKPPPDRVTLTLAKLNASHRIVLAVAGRRQGADARARDRGSGPRGARLAAAPRAPGDRRRRGGPRWLTRSGCCATPRPSGRGRASTPDAPTSRSPTRAARWRTRCARAWRATPSPCVLCSPLARARETAQLAGLEPSALDDDLLEWDYGEYEGLTTPEIRGERPDWYLWRDGSPGGESPDDVAARCDRAVARLRATEGDVAVVAHGHILRALASRWVESPVALGGHLHLGTGSVSVLAYEREVPVISRWNF